MKLIHYSCENIPVLEHRHYLQSDLWWQAKPNGLWVSVEGISAPNNYDWKQWCESEIFFVENLINSYEIVLQEESKILHLKSPQEIFVFTKLYAPKTRDWDTKHDTYQINWHEVKKNYQGIIIAPYQWKCRLALETCWYYGWDCSSGCIWDLTCIESFKKIEIENGNIYS